MAYQTALTWLILSTFHLGMIGIACFTELLLDDFRQLFCYFTFQAFPSIFYRVGLPTLDPITGLRLPVPTTLGYLLTVIVWATLY